MLLLLLYAGEAEYEGIGVDERESSSLTHRRSELDELRLIFSSDSTVFHAGDLLFERIFGEA